MDDTLRVIEFGRCRVESRQGPFRTLTFESNHIFAHISLLIPMKLSC